MISNKKIDQTLSRLTKWSEKPQWLDYLNDTYSNHLTFALNTFDMQEDELVDALDTEATVSINSAIYEDFFTGFFGENHDMNVIDDYLKRRGLREPKVSRQYLRALLDSYVSFYEVVEIAAEGRTINVRDMLHEDKTLTIQNSSDTNDLAIWDCVGARVVSMNGKYYFSNGTLRLSRISSKEIVETVCTFAQSLEREISKRTKTACQKIEEMPSNSRDVLYAAVPIATMLSHIWLTEHVLFANALLPEIRNMDNEKVMICEIRFPISGNLTEVIERLDEIEDLVRLEEENSWNWIEFRDAPFWDANRRKGSPDLKNLSISDESDIENSLLLGAIQILSKSLVLSVNSAERADRGIMFLESHLGNLVGQPLTSYQNLEQSIKKATDLPIKERPKIDEDLSEFQDSYYEEYYRRVLDEPVPMLGNKIPRKVATAKKGRSEVVEWLKTLENTEHRHARHEGTEPYDMTWIWEELKIDRPR